MFTIKSLKLPTDVKVFIQDATKLNPLESNNTTKILFQKDKSQICINLPKDLVLNKTGSLLTLTLRNHQSTSGEITTNVNSELNALLGTWMNILSNILYGLSRGFHTNLLLSGVGFRAQKKDNAIEFKLGYSHLVNLDNDPNVKLDIFKNTSLHLHGCSKEQVGNFAARIKHLRLPDAYKGKGIRMRGDNLRLKEGKKT